MTVMFSTVTFCSCFIFGLLVGSAKCCQPCIPNQFDLCGSEDAFR